MLNWLWLALANQRLGKTEEARRWLDKAQAWLDQYGDGMPARAEEELGLHLHNWLEAHVLRREAEALIPSEVPEVVRKTGNATCHRNEVHLGSPSSPRQSGKRTSHDAGCSRVTVGSVARFGVVARRCGGPSNFGIPDRRTLTGVISRTKRRAAHRRFSPRA